MIRRRDDPTIVITQTAHGWLSGQFAMFWGNQTFRFPALPHEVTIAAANHDNGWTAWEQSPELDPQQRPIDFLEMPVTTHTRLWQNGIRSLEAQNCYAALLVSHERAFLERACSRVLEIG